MKKKMSNRSNMTEFLLLGFCDIRELQILHFVLFLVLYLAALAGNFLIVSAVVLDSRLHTPMYFFLVNLSVLDLSSISVTVPKSMANSLLNTTSISYPACVAQVFFFVAFVSTNLALLTVMAYDRYVAICQPLHYERVMNRGACVQLAASAWTYGIVSSGLHTGNTFGLPFCQSNSIDQFFCEIPQLLRLVCSDLYLREVALVIANVCLIVMCFIFIFVSYVQIFKAVLRIPSEQGRQKAFSTCLPHLAVVSLFISTGCFEYVNPPSSSASKLNFLVGVLYAVVPPMMNPVIYSLRNKDLKATLRKLIM